MLSSLSLSLSMSSPSPPSLLPSLPSMSLLYSTGGGVGVVIVGEAHNGTLGVVAVVVLCNGVRLNMD